MSPLLTRPRPAPARVAVGRLVVAAVATAVLAIVALRLTADRPSFVPALTVVNPSVYKVNVDVGGTGDQPLDLGSVRREQTATFEEVIDQGERWEFRFSYAGVAGGELSLTRAQLEADGWRVTVPGDVGERLRLAGFLPSAP